MGFGLFVLQGLVPGRCTRCFARSNSFQAVFKTYQNRGCGRVVCVARSACVAGVVNSKARCPIEEGTIFL